MTATVGEQEAGEGANRRAGARLTVVAALAGAAGLVALLGWGLLEGGGGNGIAAEVAKGERPLAPAFDLKVIWPENGPRPLSLETALSDEQFNVSELRGRPAVMNMWASWCIPCRDEAPILNAAALRYQRRVAFIGVNVRDLSGDALGFLREFRVPYTSVRDQSDQAFRRYGLTGVPETYFVDRDGRIVEHIPGPVTAATLDAGLRRLLHDAPT